MTTRRQSRRFWTVCTLMGIFIALSLPGLCCEQSFPTWKRGRNFSVVVTMDGSPFSGMRVYLEAYSEGKHPKRIRARSGQDGIVHFSGVKTGKYYVLAKRLGIEVGPGTVDVAPEGPTDPIYVQWPLRAEYDSTAVKGVFYHSWYEGKENLGYSFSHPQKSPLIDAKLILSNVETEKQIATIVTSKDGSFSFGDVPPGVYILHVKESPSDGSLYTLDDDLVLRLDTTSHNQSIDLMVSWSSCGMTSNLIGIGRDANATP